MYLSVYIDRDLKWTEHINQLYKNMSNYARIFYRIRQRLPHKCLKSIYFAFVYPHLLHGIEVYENTRPTVMDMSSYRPMGARITYLVISVGGVRSRCWS